MLSSKAHLYIPQSISVDDFFRLLNQKDIKYIVLKGFDKLPKVKKSEAIHLLVHDDDLIKINNHLSPHRKSDSILCNIYTVGCETPYYPNHCAQELLNGRIFFNDKYFVPTPKHCLLSTAYYLVYYKAENSGLPRGIREEDSGLIHNNKYIKELRTLINQCGINVKLNWVDLQKFLDENNWTPELSVLKSLSEKSIWLKNLYYLKLHDKENTGEIMAFIIREWAYENNLTHYIIQWLKDHGLHILKVYELDKDTKKKAARNLRGGYWGYSKWRRYGGSGKPAVLVVAYDFQPIPLNIIYKWEYPYVSNGNFLLKIKLRNEINKNQPLNKSRSIIHSSDNTLDALEFINTLYPDEVPKILDQIALEREQRKKLK